MTLLLNMSILKVIVITAANIGYMTLTGLYDLCGAFSHDRYGK